MLNVSKLETFIDNRAAIGDFMALFHASARLAEFGGPMCSRAADACWSRGQAVAARTEGFVEAALKYERDSDATLELLR